MSISHVVKLGGGSLGEEKAGCVRSSTPCGGDFDVQVVVEVPEVRYHFKQASPTRRYVFDIPELLCDPSQPYPTYTVLPTRKRRGHLARIYPTISGDTKAFQSDFFSDK